MSTKIFDRATLLERLDGDVAMLEMLMEVYMKDVPNHLEALTNAINAADKELVRFHAHSLKGSSGNVGAVEMQTAAAALEKAELYDSPVQVRSAMDRIHQAFAALSRVLSPTASNPNRESI